MEIGEKRYQVDFKYCDRYTNGNWSSQSCQVFARSESEAKSKCVRIYGLNIDCEYEITSVREV